MTTSSRALPKWAGAANLGALDFDAGVTVGVWTATTSSGTYWLDDVALE